MRNTNLYRFIRYAMFETLHSRNSHYEDIENSVTIYMEIFRESSLE